jgi:hypothetical protein
VIRRELRRELGDRGSVSDRYLRDIVESAGLPLSASLGGLPPEFLAILRFDTLAGAEIAIARLEALRLTQPDESRRAARRAAEDAEWTARNTRTRDVVRREYAEIAQWFRIWLETPEIFAGWLAIRRRSAEFVTRFLL